MSFESTKRSIENLSKREVITLDLLFDMLVRVSMDVMEHNNTGDLCDVAINDYDDFLINVYNLMQITNSLCAKNKEAFLDIDSLTQKEYEEMVETMNGLLTDLSGIKEKIENSRAKKRELQAEQLKLQESRGYLLTIDEDCEALQRQIDVLSDSALHEKAKEKEELEVKLSEKKAKITTMLNALNSALSENFLKENLFKTSGATENCAVENCPDYVVAEAHFENIQELQQWFNDMSERINGLINVYETMLRNFVNQADKLTSESDS